MTATIDLDDPRLQRLDAVTASLLAKLRPEPGTAEFDTWAALVARLDAGPSAPDDVARFGAACRAVGALGVALADSAWRDDGERVCEARRIVDELAAAFGLGARSWADPFGRVAS